MHAIFTPGLAAEQIRDWRHQAAQAELIRQAREAPGHHAPARRWSWWPPRPARRARPARPLAGLPGTSTGARISAGAQHPGPASTPGAATPARPASQPAGRRAA